MTIIACPQGCGGFINTATESYCLSCRRSLIATEVVISEDFDMDAESLPFDPTTARKSSWCWQWWGPSDHRMRCRLPAGHDGEHDTHEARQDSMIVATDGRMVRSAIRSLARSVKP